MLKSTLITSETNDLNFFPAMLSEEPLDVVCSLADLEEELRTGISSLECELTEEHNTTVKKLKSAVSLQKFKRRARRSSLNTQVLEHIQTASTCLQHTALQVKKALKELKEGEKKFLFCNKVIFTANFSEEGWKVVNEYQ